ncbi:DUF2339 domain-containing protein [Sphingomonas cannabina]|uniref:DUF2339 domain-containing protein n=1 Tax=Sphingomonas cannabina TaxID=2899123 RepID=UPI001F483F7E|nr:DUF2339 domain-containing protein [Sphingomonas cannabina]UIJ45839.1 DUF2339 domain-containing protein [Sphingomonas cannabina]
MHRRIARLEAEVERLHDRLIALDPGMSVRPAEREVASSARPAAERRAPATVVAGQRSETPASPPEPVPPPYESPLTALPRFNLEDAIGGRLPIWIGGAALVLAGFFLVRYSMETGLLGPAVRTILAALFSLLLVAASEVARRLPLTRDDPRVGQVLAGAGVASAYGTLYIAAAQYHLVGALAGFAIMVAITALALFLALRHGPPTAVMALVGGFAAPLVAGFEATGVGPLLVYLALLVTALFGLAIRRGWSWLAIAAVAAGFGWANLTTLLLDGRDAGAVAGFVVALAIGATLALPRTGARSPWLLLAPLVAGLVQLVVLAPVLRFDALSWSFDLILAAAALILAWRDPRMRAGALAAALLLLFLIGAGLLAPETRVTPIAAVAATLLFAGAGGALSRTAREWAGVAVIGLAGPVLVAHGLAPTLLAPSAWSAIELALAAAALVLAWRHRDRAGSSDAGLVGGTAAAALLAGIALATWVPPLWASLPVAAITVGLAFWARRWPDPALARLPTLALVALVLLAMQPLIGMAGLIGESLIGNHTPYTHLPPLADLLLRVGVPGLAVAGLLVLDRTAFASGRPGAGAVAVLFIAAALYALAKQPLAIATPERFITWGFTERAIITLAFLAAGWLAWRLRRDVLGNLLAGIALLRILWFDLLILDPLHTPQLVGPAPVANAAVLLPAIAAALLVRRMGVWRIACLALTALAVAAAVRQLAHGSLLTGPAGSGENWGYSAAFLLLAIAWLWRGIATRSHTLRSFGLGLLTLVVLKVFLLDIASSGGLLRIVSLLGLGIALIGIGWAYRRVFPSTVAEDPQPSP